MDDAPPQSIARSAARSIRTDSAPSTESEIVCHGIQGTFGCLSSHPERSQFHSRHVYTRPALD